MEDKWNPSLNMRTSKGCGHKKKELASKHGTGGQSQTPERLMGGARRVGGPGRKTGTEKDKPEKAFPCSWSREDGSFPPPPDAGPAFSALRLLCVFIFRSRNSSPSQNVGGLRSYSPLGKVNNLKARLL